MSERPHVRHECPSRRSIATVAPKVLVGLVVVGMSACGRNTATVTCPSPLSLQLSPAEQEIADKLPSPESLEHPADGTRVSDLFDDLLGSAKQATVEKWERFLVTARNSSLALERQAMARVQSRYWEAISKYSTALTTCDTPAEGYDPAWAAALHDQFGDALKLNAAAVRSAIALARARIVRSCTALARAELLDAEAGYHGAIEDGLRDWTDFLKSSAGVPKEQTDALLRRSEALSVLLRKTSLARTIVNDHQLALLEAQSANLPPELASALAAQRALSRPFDLVRAIEDLSRAAQ